MKMRMLTETAAFLTVLLMVLRGTQSASSVFVYQVEVSLYLHCWLVIILQNCFSLMYELCLKTLR